MIYVFRYDIAVLALITFGMCLLAWFSVYVTIADVIYCWACGFALSRSLIASFHLGKRCKEKEFTQSISDTTELSVLKKDKVAKPLRFQQTANSPIDVPSISEADFRDTDRMSRNENIQLNPAKDFL